MADAESAPPAGGAPPETKERKLTAKELRVIEREKQAAERAAASAAKNADVFGDLPLIQSQVITGRTWTRIVDLNETAAGTTVLVRGRVHVTRDTGKVAFVTLRQGIATVQAVALKANNADMFKWIAAIPKESVVDVTASVTCPEKPVESATQGTIELQITTIFIVSKAAPTLPFQLEDAARSDAIFAAREEEIRKAEAEGREPPPRFPSVAQDTRLDYRWIDLRTPANQAIMRLSSGVCQLWRDFLLSRDFVEIQTPKIIGGASEGGASVFHFKYFGTDACLAQSPQLGKQMAAACSDFERVFEIGPVFRAENSNTHRHLCEFHGLDLEMTINEHYSEVLDLFSDLFVYIFDGLNTKYRREIEAVRAQHPFEDLKYRPKTLRLTYAEGVAMLNASGVAMASGDDFSTAQEKALGALVRAKYDVDFFFMDKYPSSVRPFYTMPDPTDASLSNSYDFFVRGEEITSGAQRVHDADMLARRAEECGIRVSTIQSYVDSFKHGALPHGGGGVGLERVVMLFLGLGNIRKASLFPRDPKRIAP